MEKTQEITMNRQEIEKILFQKDECLLPDEIIKFDLSPDIGQPYIVAVHRVPENPFWKNKHVLDGISIMPGTQSIELAIQVAAILFHKIKMGKFLSFTGLDNFTNRNYANPGDELLVRVEIIYVKSRGGKAKFEITKSISEDKNIKICNGEVQGVLFERRKLK